QAPDRGGISAVGVPAVQGHLDKRYLPLDQATRQQTALAKQVATVGIADRRLLLSEVKSLPRRCLHQSHGPVVGVLMTLRRQIRVSGQEVALHLLEQVDAGVGLVLADLCGRDQVLDAEGPVRIVLPLLAKGCLTDDQGCVPWTKEA